MSQVANGARVTCEGCGKTYASKPEWHGKKVKCRCGYVMAVPIPPPPKPAAAVEDDLYDLAPESPATAKARQHAAPPEVVAAAQSKESAVRSVPIGATAAAATSPVLGYRQPPAQREADRFSSTSDTMMDPKRDIYVPVGLLVGGLMLYAGYYGIRYDMGMSALAITTVGLSLMTLFKAVLLIGFAMVIAGPVGVSFGGIFTAALKLAAIAVFCDGVTTWVDAGVARMTGSFAFSGMLSFPVALGVYWTLLIYLFSMDPGDSWLVVMLLAVFDAAVRWILLTVLLTTILGWGGAKATALPGIGAKPIPTDGRSSKLADMKAAGLLPEARAWAKDHSAILTKQTADFYAAGAEACYYELTRDINGRATIVGFVVELPEDKEKRAAIFALRRDYYQQRYGHADDEDGTDDGKAFMDVSIR